MGKQPPQLILEEEQTLRCGYAPRVLLQSRFGKERLFVGCKDGSLAVVESDEEGTFKLTRLANPPAARGAAPPRAVRALCELDEGRLLAGRSNGAVEIIHWGRDKARYQTLVPRGRDDEDAVRYLGRLSPEHLLLSFRHSGSRIFRVEDLQEGRQAGGEPLQGRRHPDEEEREDLTIRFAVPCEPDPARWLMATSRSGIWLWNEKPSGEGGPALARPLPEIWPPGETPGFVNDIAVKRSQPGRPAQALFLATEIGVYFIDLASGLPEHAVRLSLPGFGAVCMALTYTRQRNYGFLWTADTHGDSHLFWKDLGGRPEFRPSGIVHVASQVMLALSWQRPDGSLVFAQARRNDSVAFSRYVEAEESAARTQPAARVGQAQAERLRHYRQILRTGTLEQFREELERSGRQESPPVSEWPDHAILADFFELLAGHGKGLQALQEFLSNPSARIGHEVLARLDRREEHQVERSVRLWVVTLLGIINRMRGEREPYYLGLIRWLRDLEGHAQRDGEQDDLAKALAPAVQRGIRFVRKWGLFGEANARRYHLSTPLDILHGQLSGEEASTWRQARRWPPGIEDKPEALDLLTYESLLFHRRFDVLLEEDRSQLRGRRIRDVSTLELRGRTLVAVSWSLGGVELFEIVHGPEGKPELDLMLAVMGEREANSGEPYGQHRLRFPPGARREPHEWWEGHGYSRSVLLGRVEDRCFLLTAPTLGESSRIEEIYLCEISTKEDGRLRETRTRIPLKLGESVHRFFEIEAGAILAELREETGNRKTTLALLKVGVESDRLTLRRKDLHFASELLQSTTPQNRIWSLTLAAPRHAQGLDGDRDLRVAAGFEGGEILEVAFPRGMDLEQAVEEIHPEVVARLSSPVTSLVYLSGYEGGASRLFAGGNDGSIVAWQELPGEATNGRPRFSSLWATVEEGPIASIHPWEYSPPGAPGESLVIAVTRSGRCVVFDDRTAVETPGARDNTPHPQRTRCPGARLGRSNLEATVAGSRLIDRLPGNPETGEPDPVWREETGRYAVLLTASGDGKVCLVSLHFAHTTPARREHYRSILRLWWRIARRPAPESCERLRLADAAYQAVRLLPLILVQWLLDPSWPAEPDGEIPSWPGKEGIPSWQVPRYLRPLLDLRQAWEGYAGPEAAAEALDELLRTAKRLEDLDLFQQLCSVVFKRANFELFRRASDLESEAAAKLLPLYLRIFEVVERSLDLWAGTPKRRETRARISAAKALIDGDTFWKVLNRAAREKTHTPFKRILEKRIEGVRQLVFKRDSLVSLETLRSLNLSLLRLCQRLIQKRPDDGREWEPQREPSEQEVYWPVFKSYFEALTHAAARAFRSPLELTDSLAHEYCRTFALAVCACPSAAIRIANRMTETQLISDPNSEQDLSRRVLHQFDVLAGIGIAVPRRAIALFRIASSPPEKGLNPVTPVLEALRFGKQEILTPEDPEAIASFGVENTEDLFCLCRIYKTVDWLVRLGEKLSTDARNIDLIRKKVEELKKDLNDQQLERLYDHSASFWKAALRDLAKQTLTAPSRETIRPEMVLLSRKLARWARSQIQELDRRYRDREIFQPEYPVFREALDRLARAADEFPHSAAVQKNVVLAVFGHHLLEDLDEHVLELEELAQNLDPLMVWSFRDHGRTLLPSDPLEGNGRGAVARRFAYYLLRRARHAESIPKNLRALHGFLDSPETLEADPESLAQDAEAPAASGRFSIDHLFRSFGDVWTLRADLGTKTISAREFQCLSLALAELESNHRKHSGFESTANHQGRQEVFLRRESPFVLGIESRFVWDETNYHRLCRLKKNRLQEPLMPQEKRDVPSTGAGLYLANLAASVANWKLRVAGVKKLPGEGLGICRFVIRKMPGGDDGASVLR